MADPAVAQAIVEKYPWVQALLGIPEVSQLILDSVDPNIGFDQATFQAKLQQTNWWRTTPQPAREELVQMAADPATQLLQVGQLNAGLLDWANSLGVAMDGNARAWFSQVMENRGETLDNANTKLMLRDYLRSNPQAIIPGGKLDGMSRSIYALARSDYFLPVEQWWANGWAIGMATGETDEAALRAHLQSQAANAFPHLGDWLAQGMTPADLINPMRQVAADELEIGMEQIDIGTPQWAFLTGMPNEGSSTAKPSGIQGGWRLPTRTEILEKARSDDRWWGTSHGRQTDAGMSRTLLEAFGKAAF